MSDALTQAVAASLHEALPGCRHGVVVDGLEYEPLCFALADVAVHAIFGFTADDDLVYSLSTMTVDLALPGDAGPRWGHLGEESCRVLAQAVRLWLAARTPIPQSDSTEADWRAAATRRLVAEEPWSLDDEEAEAEAERESFMDPRCGCPDQYAQCPVHGPRSPRWVGPCSICGSTTGTRSATGWECISDHK